MQSAQLSDKLWRQGTKTRALVAQLEADIVSSDNDQLKKVHCVINALYRLGYLHHLRSAGLTESDALNEVNGIYRQLHTWPSQSRFIFSAKQMRDAYKQVGSHARASDFMSEQQIVESQRETKPKREFWTILGDKQTIDESFAVLTSEPKERQRFQILAYAFRLALFQKKIDEFRQSGNFAALLESAGENEAREALQTCVGLLANSQSDTHDYGRDDAGFVDSNMADFANDRALDDYGDSSIQKDADDRTVREEHPKSRSKCPNCRQCGVENKRLAKTNAALLNHLRGALKRLVQTRESILRIVETVIVPRKENISVRCAQKKNKKTDPTV